MPSIGRRRNVVVAAVMAVVATLGPAGPARSVSGPRSTFIVQLAEPPLAAYEGGGVHALAATSPRVTGRRLDPTAPAGRSYTALLDRVQHRVLAAARAGGAPVLHRYRSTFSGFAARLTAAEAAALARTPGVTAVSADTVSHPLSARPPVGDGGVPGRETPAFLGLPAGLWASSTRGSTPSTRASPTCRSGRRGSATTGRPTALSLRPAGKAPARRGPTSPPPAATTS